MEEGIQHHLGKDGNINVSIFPETDNSGAKWTVIVCQDTGAGWDWDEMPEDAWERYSDVKRATEKYNGIFDYKAERGKGAVVTIKLPATVIKCEDIDEIFIFEVLQGGRIMKKVLIVDDELEFTKDFAKALVMFGYEPYQAADGEGAFSIIENKKPDIVLCDYKLPDVEGDKILEKTKKNYPNIKFVMVTAYYDEDVAKRFRNLGADEVIFKPIVLTDIEALLAKL